MSSTGEPVVGPLRIRVDRMVTTTITLLAVLIIYDGWEHLTFGGVAAVIVGPVVAIFLSHVYAAALERRVALGRPLVWDDRWSIVGEESRFLLVAVGPLAILVVLAVFGVSYSHIVQVIVGVGVLSLGFWAGVAGRRASLTGWAMVAAIGSGLLLGALILVLQAMLQPGKKPFQP